MLKHRGKPVTTRRVERAIRSGLLGRFERINSFRGAYDTFAEAESAVPTHKPVGYDLAKSDGWYLKKLEGGTLEDYPVLFWLRGALEESRTVYEIGGHVGVAYYGYQSVLTYPDDLESRAGCHRPG